MENQEMKDILGDLEKNYLNSEYDTSLKNILANKDKFDPGVFYYNSGTLYIKKGNYPVARYHLEKAIKKGYINSKVYNNLNTVKNYLGVESSSQSKVDVLTNFAMELPGQVYLSLTLLMLIFVITLFRFKYIKLKKTFVTLIVISLIPFLFSSFYLRNLRFAISFEEIEVREGPSGIYPKSNLVKAGTKLIVGSHSNGWVYIKSPVHLTGWTKKEALGLY